MENVINFLDSSLKNLRAFQEKHHELAGRMDVLKAKESITASELKSELDFSDEVTNLWSLVDRRIISSTLPASVESSIAGYKACAVFRYIMGAGERIQNKTVTTEDLLMIRRCRTVLLECVPKLPTEDRKFIIDTLMAFCGL